MAVDGVVQNVVITPIGMARLAKEFSSGVEISIGFCAWALKNLVWNVGGFEVSGGLFGTYAINVEFVEKLLNDGELDGALLGYRYFLPIRSKSIVEILVEDHDGLSTRTGFVLNFGSGQEAYRRLVSCTHVVFKKDGRPRKNLRFFVDEKEISVDEALPMSRIDVCFMRSPDIDEMPGLSLRIASLLDRVYTAGYPRVILDRKNPLLYHPGEVNGWLGRKEEGDLYAVTSADVAPGNSGGPVFGDLGYVVGIISNQYLDKRPAQIAKHNLFVPTEQLLYEISQQNFGDPVNLRY